MGATIAHNNADKLVREVREAAVRAVHRAENTKAVSNKSAVTAAGEQGRTNTKLRHSAVEAANGDDATKKK